MVEEIAAVDVHALRNGAEPVGGVEIGIAADRMVETPKAFAAVGEFDGAEVVEVAAFGGGQVAEQTLAGHVQHHQLNTVVAAVFEHDAVLAGRFGGFHQLPAFLHSDGGGHLSEGVFTVLHRLDAHRDVPFPRRGDVDGVEVRLRAEAFEVEFTLGVASGARLAGLFDGVLDTFDEAWDDVANGFDPDTFEREQIPHVAEAARAHADDAGADFGDGFGLGGECGR